MPGCGSSSVWGETTGEVSGGPGSLLGEVHPCRGISQPAGALLAGLFEFNFGDSEVLMVFLFLVSAPYALGPTPGKRVGTSNRLTPYKDHPRRNTKDKKESTKGHGRPRRDTKTDGSPSTTSGAKMLPQFCALGGMKACWERGRPGRTKPGTASAISPTWINRERRHGSPSAGPMGFSPTGWLPAASHWKLSGGQRTGCGRDARAPRRYRPGGAVGVSGGRLLRKPTCTLWETPVCQQPGPPPPDRADHSRVKQRDYCGLSRARTLLGEALGDKTSCFSCPFM